jgi:hypothetical protein
MLGLSAFPVSRATTAECGIQQRYTPLTGIAGEFQEFDPVEWGKQRDQEERGALQEPSESALLAKLISFARSAF